MRLSPKPLTVYGDLGMRLFFRFLGAFVVILSFSLLQKNAARGASIDSGVTDVYQWENKSVYAETTVSPVLEEGRGFATSVASMSAFQIIQETNTASSPVSLQEDAKHTGKTGETAAIERQNFMVATQHKGNIWQMSTLSQNFEHTTLALSNGISTSSSPENVTEQDQNFSLFTNQGYVQAASIMNGLRLIGSYEEFVTNCSGTGERLCGCSASCTVVDNCCYDSEYVEAAIESTADNTHRYSCYSNINEKWTLSSPSRLINQCSDNWTDEAVRGLCENPAGNDLKTYIPCYSPKTRLSYRNIYCLHCNGLLESSLWEATFQAAHPYHFFYANSFDKLNNSAGRPLHLRGKQFVLSPQTGFEPSHCSFAVDKCNSEFTTETLSKMCSAYYNPVLIKDTMYRNVYCFQCATGLSIEAVHHSLIARRRQNPMSLLLNIKLDQKRMACPASGCVPEITRIRGYSQAFFAVVSVTLVANISHLDKEAITDLNGRSISTPIITFINAKLKEYKHNVRVLIPKTYELEEVKEVKIILLITDDILVGNITTIDQLVLSTHFETDVDNLVHVNCCQDVHVLGSQPKASPRTEEIQRDSLCAEMTCSENNTTIPLAVNSAQMSPVSSIGFMWLFLIAFANGSLVTSVVNDCTC